MINKKSVATAYDEHLTLVEWLQAVENALDNAVLTNLGIAKLSDHGNVATYRVTATFADNTTIVSDTFTLPSTDIVTAFNDLTALVNGFDDRITDNTNDVASIIDIIDIGNDKIKASTLQNSINGSDEVIVDIDETNDKLEIHLSDELQAKLARVLLKPSSAPSTRKVVTIDTNGAQDNVDGTELTTLMDNIVDSHGNKRFVEGNISLSLALDNSYNLVYGKWSLSGTHLMIVLAVKCTTNNSILAGAWFNETTFMPNYIYNKIYSSSVIVGGTRNLVSINQPLAIRNSAIINGPKFFLQKSNGGLQIVSFDDFTFSTDDYLRIQFDLLIDSE